MTKLSKDDYKLVSSFTLGNNKNDIIDSAEKYLVEHENDLRQQDRILLLAVCSIARYNLRKVEDLKKDLEEARKILDDTFPAGTGD